MKNQTFGVEIETTGLGRERTAQVIAELFGTTARYIGRHLGDWHIPMPDGRKWVVERDGSVTDPSAEVVSPVCRWDDIPMVQEVVRALRQAGAKADASCGIHIHVGLGEHTPQSLRRLTNIVNAKEDLLTQALGISPSRRRQWCKPVDPAFLAELNRRKPATMDALAQLWYKTNNPTTSDWRDCASSHYDHSRYHLLNLHAAFSTERPAHTIEFRAFNGTLHAGEVKAYIQLCLAISHQALTTKAASRNRHAPVAGSRTFKSSKEEILMKDTQKIQLTLTQTELSVLHSALTEYRAKLGNLTNEMVAMGLATDEAQSLATQLSALSSKMCILLNQ